MTLPRRPKLTNPIPNTPFSSPEVTSIKGPYWDMALGAGLEPDGKGSIQTDGSEPSEPSTYLYGPNGFVGLGTGLEIGPDGSLQQGDGYIYCTPAYPDLPPTVPPYSCNTEVNTTGVVDFTDAWRNCDAITQFPCVDSSAVTDFSYAWYGCDNLISFPPINTSSGENFTYSWAYSGLHTFPRIDVSNAVDLTGTWESCSSLTSFPNLEISSVTYFYYTWSGCSGLSSFPSINTSSINYFGSAWEYCTSLSSFPFLDTSLGNSFSNTWKGCTSLSSFPLLDTSSGTLFYSTWAYCSSLTSFPAGMFNNCLAIDFYFAWKDCSLNQTSIDNILVSLNTAGQSGGIVHLNGGTSATPGAAGLAAKASLQARGWTVLTN